MKSFLKTLIVRILFFVLAVSLIFCFNKIEYDYSAVFKSISNGEDVSNEFENQQITNLSIPSINSYSSEFFNARNPWDMVVDNGILYVGSGDYGINPGGAYIYGYDIASGKWIEPIKTESEAVLKFFYVNGTLYTPGIDPIGNKDIGNYYLLENGKWIKKDNLPDAAHNYDITCFNGNMFYAIGTWKDADVSPVKMSEDNGVTFKDVPFLNNGINVILEEDVSYIRVYEFLELNNCLYAVTMVFNASGVRDYMIYKYTDGVFEYHSNLLTTGIKNTHIWQDIIGGKAKIGDTYYFTTGNIYASKDMLSFEVINTPDNGLVTHLFTENENGKDVLYVLSVLEKEDKSCTSTIWKYKGNNEFTKIVDFTDSVGALSFVKYDNCFFVGLGRENSTNEKVGTILKINMQ